ncbi:MAG: hypothetical protein E7019_00755 [Alphaproteobacteria bacterium]|nr:hypothetical protein [Alphaproteobacteria bacterium]
MVASRNIEEEKSTIKPLLIFGMALCFALLCFFILSVASLAFVHFFVCGATGSNCCVFEHNEISDSGFIYSFFQAYENWFLVFKQSFIDGKFNLFLMLPILVQIFSLLLLGFLLFKSSYSFSLWFVLRNHFADIQDVEKMGLKGGKIMALGRLGGNLLGISRAASVLCVGETGCGKTSTLAVPSILRSDNVSVIAIDNTGTLSRHTSGYRSKVSDVFYFNWDVSDNKDKGIVYPRWNPLAEDNIPTNADDKIEYLHFLSTYLVSDEKGDATDNYWQWLSSGTLLSLIYFLMIKCKQAMANDYFLGKIVEGIRLTNDDKDILMSYYALMPEDYSKKGLEIIQKENVSLGDYMPIGSWEGVPISWQGHDLCFGMVADWLLQNYLSNKDGNSSGDWRQWLESLLLEAEIFNYGGVAINGIKQFLYLSKLQRQLVFAQILKPLRVFLNQNVREKTSGNDFKMSDWAGQYDENAKKGKPITIYAAANTKTTKFINRLFVDVLLNYGVLKPNNRNKIPVLVVLDDVGQMLKVRNLAESVAKGPMFDISFLLLCNSLNNLENTYGKEVLENIVANTSYKIVMADTNAKMSKQLNKLALFATKSVQIPLGGTKLFKMKKHFADANYYHYWATKLKVKKNLQVETRGYQLLLAEGYYHLPILTKNMTFMKDNEFKEKAVLPVNYFLDSKIVALRDVQDFIVPNVDDVLRDADLGFDDEVELGQYMEVVYNDVRNQMPEDPKMSSVMIDDISTKWKKREIYGGADIEKKSENWWLNETSFEQKNEKKQINPFIAKK